MYAQRGGLRLPAGAIPPPYCPPPQKRTSAGANSAASLHAPSEIPRRSLYCGLRGRDGLNLNGRTTGHFSGNAVLWRRLSSTQPPDDEQRMSLGGNGAVSKVHRATLEASIVRTLLFHAMPGIGPEFKPPVLTQHSRRVHWECESRPTLTQCPMHPQSACPVYIYRSRSKIAAACKASGF